MSTITVSNINDGTTSVPSTYVTNGSAKAWVNFNGTGTIAARDSLNLSSLTDNGTGDYTVNFSNAFDTANYSAPSNGALDISGAAALISAVSISRTGAQTASALRVQTYFFASTSNAVADFVQVQIAAHGDLA